MEIASRATFGALLVTLAATTATTVEGQPVPWSDPRWRIVAQEYRVEPFGGREALLLRGGTAWLDGAELRNGVIEFDVAAPADLGFHGVAFRATADDAYDHFYLRPFVSGSPDATQYTPVFHGVSGWQIYAGARYALPATIPPDGWAHVRMAIRDDRLEVSVDDRLLVFPDLVRPAAAGAVGLTSSGAPARFANLVVTTDDAPEMEGGEGAPPDEVPPGTVRRWRVSTPFPEARLEPLACLDPRGWADLEWDALDAGVRGVANLAMLRGRSAERNTVFAAVTLRVREAGPVRVRFGFSDRVHLVLNGRTLYRGADGWRSRDYRFLGTVGLFDELVLPLEVGENELWLAVSEDFGGWGVTLQLADAEAVEVVDDAEGGGEAWSCAGTKETPSGGGG